MAVELNCNCDECEDALRTDGGEKCYCGSCYEKLEGEIEELNDEIKSLQEEE